MDDYVVCDRVAGMIGLQGPKRRKAYTSKGSFDTDLLDSGYSAAHFCQGWVLDLASDSSGSVAVELLW